MSKIKIKLKDGHVQIRQERGREKIGDFEDIDLSIIESGSRLKSRVRVKRNDQKNRILFSGFDNYSGSTLIIYTDDRSIYCRLAEQQEKNDFYDLIDVKIKPVVVKFFAGRLWILFFGFIVNKYDLDLKKIELYIDNENRKALNIPILSSWPSKFFILLRCCRLTFFSVKNLNQVASPNILSPVFVSISTKDIYDSRYHLYKGNKSYDARRPLFYYAPLTVLKNVRGKSLHIRRFSRGGLVLVRRKLADIETTLYFKFYESFIVSLIFYIVGSFVKTVSGNQVNIYFEKEAMKAEEGTIEVFRKARSEGLNSKNLYIIRKDTNDYKTFMNEPGVIANFTLKSYWYIYRANSIISTEAPSHVNILRSNNKFLRKSLYKKKFIFLQHGVTYMKSQTSNSAFMVGREAEPDYILAGSIKEQDALVDMLGLPEERVIVAGLPIFDLIQYNHIDDSSHDIATIMLTWKPYEEHIDDFSQTTYYKNTVMIARLLKKLLPDESVRIIAHPKVVDALANTDLGASLWKGKISDALVDTKLLITDYSSVCYNSFYQGSGVIFYQSDLAHYELDNGELIPDNEEYIGPRIYNKTELLDVFNELIVNEFISISKIRTEKEQENYLSINAFHDGNNIDRLLVKLKKLKII